ncbi:MAG: aldehyde dehydrogenase family protein [Cryobacterium sp.]|nr:aldehyde dehydrogenase family protein [Cryobacterium sp.]
MSGTFPSDKRIQMLCSALSNAEGKSTPINAPFTGKKLYDLPTGTAKDVAAAASKVRLAQVAWQASTPAARKAVLLKAHDLIVKRREDLLDLLQSETGKTRGQAFEEIFQSASVARYYALSANRVLRSRGRRSAIPTVLRARVNYQPKGLIGVVTPWNYPLSLAAMDVIPALAAGNGVLQKADNQGALSVLALREAFVDAGLPADLWAVVTGDGAEIGDAINDVSDYICFTGSTATGTKVGLRAAAALRGASLELGGKNPMIVLDDVDPVKAARAAVYACFSSMGQLCVSIERIYVLRGVAEAFTTEFAKRTRELRQSAAFDYSSDVGSLTLPSQLKRVEEHVKDAVDKGAKLLAGGQSRPELGPLFFAPTVLTDVTSEMRCSGNETFGPVVAISVVDSETEAVIVANDSEFGLNSSIFSGSVRRARRIAALLHTGSVNINEGYRASFSTVAAPMGGMKSSGLGRRNGSEGLLRFVESQTVANATGYIRLPNTGAEFSKLSGLLLILLKTLRLLHRK